MKNNNLFGSGSTWVRADFHLHTRKDGEFRYEGEENRFVDEYVKRLEAQNIRVGVITNHNKFDRDEFKALRKKAGEKKIFLLPGVELSVSDGRGGIHVLVVFDDEWIDNKENRNYIQDFLTVTFSGQANYDKHNARSNDSILQTIQRLDRFGKDYFLVFAHVEAKNGLVEEIKGGRFEDLGSNELFKTRTAAFQKVVSETTRGKLKQWLGKKWYPAEVQGSDCKSLDEIGRGQEVWLKVGAFGFGAVKYALYDHQHRVSSEVPGTNHSHIRSISFEGGVLDGRTVRFSPGLNTLIGIRGSGKSTVLEILRYVLDIPFGDKAMDKAYKWSLINHAMGSGGKAVVRAVDSHGREYEIHRILDKTLDIVSGDNERLAGIKVNETVLNKPMYFGQKDLSSTGEGFEKDLVDKFIGDKLVGIRKKISEKQLRINDLVESLKKLDKADKKKDEYESEKKSAEFNLKIFEDHGVNEQLKKQVGFEQDYRKLEQIFTTVGNYLDEYKSLIDKFEDDLLNHKVYRSEQNASFFGEFFALYDKLLTLMRNSKENLAEGGKYMVRLKEMGARFNTLRDELKDEFASSARRLAEELKQNGQSSIRPDDYMKLKATIDRCSQILESMEKEQSRRASLEKDLQVELNALNDLWQEEFRLIEEELREVNEKHSSLEITAEFKGDKDAFVDMMKNHFKGSHIRDLTFRAIADKCEDFIQVYNDHFSRVRGEFNDNFDAFRLYFTENIDALLAWQVPNKYTIKYMDKELKHHSLGQRASALILFILSREKNDVIMIDQPEDDLDNQTIYQDVVRLILRVKTGTQFIFATHNANFPVLGDAEQVHCCRYHDEEIVLRSGSIDDKDIRREIVNIMEGGEEAFRKRKEIYNQWNPRSFSK